MRVLYLSPWFPYPLDTGARTRFYYLLKALAERHQVSLLTLDPYGWAPAQIEAVKPLCERAIVVPRDPFRHSRVHMATQFFSLRPVVAHPFPEMLSLVNDLHASEPFDVAISGTVAMAAYVTALSGVPRILEEHNSGTRWMAERYYSQTAPIQRLRCWVSWRKSMRYESKLFRHFDLVSMVSTQDAAATQAMLPDNGPPVAVFPNGVDCSQLRPGLTEPEPNTLVFSGALTYGSNYEAMQFFLSQVYPLIRAKRPDVKLRITGMTNGVNVQQLQLDESVTLTGFVEDIRQEIAGAWISVVPIRSGGGTRLKILEAMALGTPVVSTTKGAEGIEVRNGEHLLLADEPAAFADHTLQLLRDANLRQHLITHARNLVEAHYDWASIGQQFVAAVERTVSNC